MNLCVLLFSEDMVHAVACRLSTCIYLNMTVILMHGSNINKFIRIGKKSVPLIAIFLLKLRLEQFFGKKQHILPILLVLVM